MLSIVLESLDATDLLGTQLASVVEQGDVIELTGEPGSGKTTLVGALARAMGITEPVRSPTYTIAHRYDGPTTSLSHIDLYRLDGALDAQTWGDIEPYFESGVGCIEWPGEGMKFWRPQAARIWRVTLEYVGGGDANSRRLSIDSIPNLDISARIRVP